jgi:hypothetical protein
MTIQRMEHVGIVVDDLAAATEFLVELGLELQGKGPVEGRWVDRVTGLDGVRAEIAILLTPDGHGRLELTKSTRRRPRAATGTRRRTHRAYAMSHSPSKTSTPSSPACEPAARSSSASWSATRTATGSATSAAPRGSSSSWQSKSADGSGPPPTPDQPERPDSRCRKRIRLRHAVMRGSEAGALRSNGEPVPSVGRSVGQERVHEAAVVAHHAAALVADAIGRDEGGVDAEPLTVLLVGGQAGEVNRARARSLAPYDGKK